jgi:preprotein translocase subunit YajC
MFDKLLALEATAEGQPAGGNWLVLIVIYGVFILAIYLLMFRPQKKQQKALKELLSQLEIGDVVLTSSGFYGTIIDIADDTVIVEFGNNKNCRIPMQKTAIVDCEKQESASQTESK